MIRKGVEQVVYYQAWDTAANAPKPGDVGNHTLQVIKDGALTAATNSPSEVDATNAPGICKIILTATEWNGDFVALGGVSSTGNVIIVPVMILTDTNSKGSSRTVVYQAFDTDNNVGKTGDVGNHTLRVITDGSSAGPSNSASEIDDTAVPGLYTITLTDPEMDGFTVSLGGKSDTADVEIIPLHMATDRGRYFVDTNAGDTVRQQIMDAIDTRLQTILIANGYKTNAGQKVFPWKEYGLGSTKLPALTFRDVDDDPDQETIGNVDNILTVEVQALTTQSATSDEVAREMLADVIVAVGADETWGDLAEFTLLPSSPMAVEQLEKKIFGAQIILVIEYRTARFDPYGR